MSAAGPIGDGAWRVKVSDRRAAEVGLARSLVALGAPVTEIRAERRSLEDIYLEITDIADLEASDDV